MKSGIEQTMTTKPESSSNPNAGRDTANLGLIRPPFVYLVSLVAGLLIQLALPLPFLPRTSATPLGAALVVVAVALFLYSVAKFRRAGTPVPAREPTTTIVRTGPYGLSRNPIYLAFSLFQLGIALWVDSVWLLATLVVAVALMHYVVIPREEHYLERKFGGQYLEYKASVRRWL
jgi:protein-S-isoprenylcysteine O-methyltransferase Ste14